MMPAGVIGQLRPRALDRPAVVAVELTRRFGSRVAVDGVTLTVARGQILAVLGPNGAGKTTTVRMLSGLLRPTAGGAEVAGFDVGTQPEEVRRRVGLMTDVPGLYAEMQLRAYLRWYGRIYGLSAGRAASRVDELVDVLGLTDWAHSALAALSRGTQQKVALARCLLHDPEVLLLDEPTAALDVEATIGLRTLFAGLKDAGRAIILCTHNLAEAERVADTVAILIGGRIVHMQSLREAGSWRQCSIRLTNPSGLDVGAIAAVPGIDPRSLRLENGTLMFACHDPVRTNPAVVALLVQQGCGVVQVEERAPSLEALYVSHLREAGRANG
jgi:ABC-2 type transport system ATP-binding protein